MEDRQTSTSLQARRHVVREDSLGPRPHQIVHRRRPPYDGGKSGAAATDMDEAQRLVDEQSVRKEGSIKRSWSRASVDDAAEESPDESPPAPVDL